MVCLVCLIRTAVVLWVVTLHCLMAGHGEDLRISCARLRISRAQNLPYKQTSQYYTWSFVWLCILRILVSRFCSPFDKANPALSLFPVFELSLVSPLLASASYLKEQYLRILMKNIWKWTRIINKMWRNISFDVMTTIYCVGEISTEVSMLGS